jgi:hypothetical protein
MAFRSHEPQPNNDGGAGKTRLTRRELASIRQVQDELGVARCPLCRAVLVARQGRKGPYFSCACVDKALKKAA